MGRPRGSRNPDFEQTRASLLRAAHDRLNAPDGAHASFRELAAATEVSVATLRHYFGSREGLIAAVLARSHEQGAPYLLRVATGPLGSLRASVRWLLQQLVLGLRHGAVADVHALGLAAGLRDPRLGPAYLDEVLEPTLQAVEARLARHQAAGELVPCDLRTAALVLVSPVLLAVLHQGLLGGAQCRPMDVEAFLEAHRAGFLRAYGRDHAARRRARNPATERSTKRLPRPRGR